MASDSPATILVVDDNPAGLYATSRILRGAGFTVLEAETGLKGVSLAASVDLVVLDVNLPDISGFEVCRRIRSTNGISRLPVVHLSATFVKDTDKVEGLESGADGYLTHPVEPPVLVATVNAFLRARRAEAERERLLIAERAAREEAERANRLKDEFLATLSHELRTPLNAIVGWSQILRAGGLSADDLAQGVDAIERNARAQAQLISDLLDVSRITSGKLRLDVRVIDPAAAIADALETVAPAVHAKGIRLERVLAPDAGTIHGDPDRVQQVVWNLVNNAVKFTPRGGTIRVALARDAAAVTVTVADDGQGIRADFLPHIFERFRQEDATTTRNQGGLGLGLAIVKHLVEMHGGTIAAHSDGENRGTTIIVRLPIAAIRPEATEPLSDPDSAEAAAPSTTGDTPRAAPAPSPSPTLRGVRVLVVEDDPDARDVLVRVLTKAGADVQDASNVRAALDLLPAFDPHVLLSDVGMPHRDGHDLIRAVRARGHDADRLPAIALTAFARQEDRQQSLLAGFQRHLAKPVDPAELLAAIADLAGGDARPPLPI